MSASRLAFTLVALVLAFAGGLADAYLADRINFLHPTILHSYFDIEHNSHVLDMETVRINATIGDINNWRFDPNYRPSEDTVATSAWPQNPVYLPVNITYKMEQEAIESNLKSINGSERYDTCHFYSAFRAYELVMHPRGTYFAIGITDNYAFLIRFKVPPVYEETALILQNTTNMEFSKVLTLPHRNGPWYAPSAVAARIEPVAPIIDFSLLDEAGNLINATIDIIMGMSLEKSGEGCLSTISLDKTTCKLNKNPTTDKKIDPIMFKHLRTHFDHSFVESIQFFDDKVCWSTGLRVPSLGKFKCYNKRSSDEKQVNESYRAMETYRYNNRTYSHVLSLDHTDGLTDPYPHYSYWNVEKASELGKSGNDTKFKSYLLPVDIVYAAKCQKLFAIYMHMYQEFKPDERLDTQSNYIAIDWMTFPVNAILYHKDRLYLFSSGNKLKITSELPDDCDLTQVTVEAQDYYQSDLLLAFKAGVANKPYEKLLPIYDSNKWFNGSEPLYPIEDYTTVPASLRLGNFTISSNISIMVMITISVLLLFCIICGLIYFIYFSGSLEAEINPRSNSRK